MVLTSGDLIRIGDVKYIVNQIHFNMEYPRQTTIMLRDAEIGSFSLYTHDELCQLSPEKIGKQD